MTPSVLSCRRRCSTRSSTRDGSRASNGKPSSYNVLRILRGVGAAGLSRNDIRDRLVALVPDVTRLIDRLEEAGLVDRERWSADRRIVTTESPGRGSRCWIVWMNRSPSHTGSSLVTCAERS